MLASRKKEEGLPDVYQEVEYIENTGTQYIATDYSPSATEQMKIELDYMFTARQSGDVFLFASKSDSLSTTITFQCEIYNHGAWYCSSGIMQFRNVLRNVGTTLNTRYYLAMDGGVLTVNESSVNSNGARTEGTVIPIYIFAGNWPNGLHINTGARIYKLTFTANGKKEADFIPCYRKSDTEIGMYDLVGKRFYANAGTGVFLKGNDVA